MSLQKPHVGESVDSLPLPKGQQPAIDSRGKGDAKCKVRRAVSVDVTGSFNVVWCPVNVIGKLELVAYPPRNQNRGRKLGTACIFSSSAR